jgi:outer membrane biosynthesis protein TonB
MTEAVTDIIVARSSRPEGMQMMVLWSAAGHVVLIVLLLFSGTRIAEDRQQPVMTISLGGAPGPRTGGLTQLGARAVQAPPIETPERPVPSPPAPVPPKMTLPDPRSKPQPQPKVDKAPPESTAKRANTGPQPTDGNARADTGVVRGQGFGLSSAGGGGGPVQLDVTDFCCPDYLAQLVTLIQQSWDQNQGVVGSTTVKITMPQVEVPSGFLALDNSAMRAVQTARLPPLPVAFQNPTLTVHMRFDYQR